MIAKILTLTALSFIFAACAPQAELVKIQSEMDQVRQDAKSAKAGVLDVQRRISLLDANIKGTVDVQKVMADYGAKSDQLDTDIHLLQGKLEENNYRIADLAQKLDDRSVKIAALAARIDELESKVRLLSSGTGTAVTRQTSTGGRDQQTARKTIEPSEVYRQAKSDYDKGRFDLALAGFQNYIAQFPDSSMADKAQYWIGECFYAKKEFNKSIEAFALVIKNYPASDKVAGAKLKIGLSYLSERNHSKAREYLKKVVKEYPGSNEADIAKDRLSKIGR